MRNRTLIAILATCLLTTTLSAQGQRGGQRGQAPQTPRAAAVVDLTGYWVSLVTEDWRWRMVTPAKGDFASIPTNPAGIAEGQKWDPAKDEAAGEQCKSYGAPAIMRVPTRLLIGWDNDNTLKIETDAGRQTRLLHFGEYQPSGTPSLQGNSAAAWEGGGGRRGGPPASGSLKVVTKGLKPGYLRKNGYPYSDKTTVTEFYDRTNEENGESLLIVTTIVNDPVYLIQEFITSTHFKKEADAKGWDPQPCTAR